MIATLSLMSCGDELLTRPSKTSMDDMSFWTSESNIRLFVNGGYEEYFTGYANSWGQEWAPGVYSSGEMSDDARTVAGTLTSFPAAPVADNWYRTDDKAAGYGSRWLYRTGGGPWNFGFVRKWNLLRERLATMKEEGLLSDEAYNHWDGVALFFRSYEYYRLVVSFGDVPWYDHVVGSTDLDDQFKDRDSRVTVMTNVMNDLKTAVSNVRADDGANYVNKYVVAALASRFMLFEGTWEKYHKVSGAKVNEFLTAAADFAKIVIDSKKYACNVDFRKLFGEEAQVGNEALIYRAYSAALSCTHCIASYCNLGEGQSGYANLAFLKAVRTSDGAPYTTFAKEGKDWEISEMMKNCDPRFEATFYDEPYSGGSGIYCVKFIDRVGPTYTITGEARPAKYGSMTNTNGYPCVRYSEVLLNYAEAKAELGQANQTVIDETINVIRKRPIAAEALAKGVKPMADLKIDQIVEDPQRTSEPYVHTLAGVVDPLLWEIRQERRMEFFMEQFRVVDIRRWGWLELMDGENNPDIMVGAWVDLNKTKDQALKFNLLFNNDGSRNSASYGQLQVKHLDGSVAAWSAEIDPTQMVGFRIPNNIKNRNPFSEKNYLEAICTDVTNQYKDAGYTITQNPGW